MPSLQPAISKSKLKSTLISFWLAFSVTLSTPLHATQQQQLTSIYCFTALTAVFTGLSGILLGVPFQNSLDYRASFIESTCTTSEASVNNYTCAAVEGDTCTPCSSDLATCDSQKAANIAGPCCIPKYKCCQEETYVCGYTHTSYKCGQSTCYTNTPVYCTRCISDVPDYMSNVVVGDCYTIHANASVVSAGSSQNAICPIGTDCSELPKAESCKNDWIKAHIDTAEHSCYYKRKDSQNICSSLRTQRPPVNKVAEGFGITFGVLAGITLVPLLHKIRQYKKNRISTSPLQGPGRELE